jgi:hypothetical protein
MPKDNFGSARSSRQAISLRLVGLTILFEFFIVPAFVAGQTIQEVRVQWTTSPPLSPGTTAERRGQPVSHLFSILERRTMSGRIPRQREPELSSDRVVIVARDLNGKVIDWQVVPDPRVIRAETPGPRGELSGRVLYHPRADFLFTLPHDPGIARIDFYQPWWNGANFDLDLIGGVSLQ